MIVQDYYINSFKNSNFENLMIFNLNVHIIITITTIKRGPIILWS